MAKQTIAVGSIANDGTGDTLRVSFGKANANFTELYTSVATIPTDVNELTDADNLLGGGGGTSTSQTYLELTDSAFIVEPVTLGSAVTITVPNRGTSASIDLVISEGEGPVIDSISVDANNRGTGYVVGQVYRIPYYNIGASGGTDASSIDFTVATVGAGGTLLTITDAGFVGQALNSPGEYSSSSELRAYVFDTIDTGVVLARNGIQGMFNSAEELEYDNDIYSSPAGTEWNSDGWGTLSGVANRKYTTWADALEGAVGNYILTKELVMHDIINDKYYKFDFTVWNGQNGGYSYTRRLITDPNYFSKLPYENGSSGIDTIIPGVLAIRRDGNGGIYNNITEEGWSDNISPEGTLWNIDGWNDLSNIADRTYDNLYAAFGNGGLGNKIVGTECIMSVPAEDKYYAIKFLDWTQNNQGGGFSYLRYEIDQTALNEGVRFPDGTVQKTAYNSSRIKSTANRGRRIEEVTGYKTFGVTEGITTNLTGTASRTVNDTTSIWVDIDTTTIDAVISTPSDYNDARLFQFSVDNTNWYDYDGHDTETGEWLFYTTATTNFSYESGDTVYFRYVTGGLPVVWWDQEDLPSGGGNFRGAVIDYHAYTGNGTIIGTIHIVNDNNEEYITHTEVSSGGDSSISDDLWLVQNEGTISYRRLDLAANVVRIHWTAKVFYGSDFYD